MSIEKDIQDFQKSVQNQINDSIIDTERDFELFKSVTINLLQSCDSKESFEKSWSGDLQKQFPDGVWRKINGASVFINNGRVVAGLDKFNGMIDDFFSKKESGKGQFKVEEKKDNSEKKKEVVSLLHSNRDSVISSIKYLYKVWKQEDLTPIMKDLVEYMSNLPDETIEKLKSSKRVKTDLKAVIIWMKTDKDRKEQEESDLKIYGTKKPKLADIMARDAELHEEAGEVWHPIYKRWVKDKGFNPKMQKNPKFA